MKKMILSLAAAGILGTAGAAMVELNGTFEKCTATPQGVVMPEGWDVNKGVSKGAEVRATRDEDGKRNGFFGVKVDVEKDGSAYMHKWQSINVKKGDVVTIKVWVKGKGKVACGFYCNNEKGAFLCTIASPMKDVDSEEWVEYEAVHTIDGVNNDKIVPSSIIPVIYVGGDSRVALDDYSFDLASSSAQ